MASNPAEAELKKVHFDEAPVAPKAQKPLFANIPGNTPEIEEKANALLDSIGANEGDAEGIRSLQNLTQSVGLPAARISFEFMLDAFKVSSKLRSEAMKEIKAFSPITEVGCMQVDFFNMITAKADTAYLVLDRCPFNHDLGAELRKIKTLIEPDKWVEVVKHLSMMVYLGRTVYSQTAAEHKPLLRRIYDRKPDDNCEDLMKLGIDSRNTTLFVDPRWPMRIGIFVRMQSQIEK